MTAALYVVATPLGNLGDITLRALETLRSVDAIACEDTRHSRHLLDHYEIRAPLIAVHEHNEAEAAQKLLRLLATGKCIALVSDAGTPGICDPGARVVSAVRAAGYAVRPLPGANAAIAALSVSGFDAARVLFCGFLPVKAAARQQAITELGGQAAALVFYEAPHRIVATVADLATLLAGEREVLLARELTKLFEQSVRLPLAGLPAWLAADENHQRGEFVLVIAPPPAASAQAAQWVDAQRTLRLLLDELPLKQAVALAVRLTGVARNTLYEQALAWRSAADAASQPTRL